MSHAPPRVPKQRRPWDAALPPGSGSPLAGSPAWHGLPQCPGYGHWVSYCCVAFVLRSGLCLGLGFGNPASPGWGLGRVCLGTVCGLAPSFAAGVRGFCGWAWVSACTPPVLVRLLGRAWLCAPSSCSPPFPVLVCGVGVCAGVRVWAAPRLYLGRCWGVCVLVCPSCVVSGTSWLRVRCGGVWLGLGCCRTPPLLAGVLGRVCICVCPLLVPRFSSVGCAVWACVLGLGFGCAPSLLVGLLGCVCGHPCAPLAPALPGGPPVVRGCAGVAVGEACPPPSPLVFFWGGGLCGVGRWLSRSWVSWSLSSHPFSSGPRCLLFVLSFFSSHRGVCPRVLGVPSPPGPLPSAWCCGFWLVSPPAPLSGSVFGAVWAGGLAASCGVGGRCGG